MLAWGELGKLFYAVIDLGRAANYGTLRPALHRIGRFELFAISHIDADHIEGAMPLLKERTAPFIPKDVWFNAWHHLRNAGSRLKNLDGFESLSVTQGEKLSAGIIRFDWPWNKAFGTQGIVSTDTPEAQRPIELDGGLKLALLSPSDRELAALEPVWMEELSKANLRPFDPDETRRTPTTSFEVLSTLNIESLAKARFTEDKSEPNGSSIAFLAEFAGRRALLGADAHPKVIERSIRRLGYNEKIV